MDQTITPETTAPVITKSKRKYYFAIALAILVLGIVVVLVLTSMLSQKNGVVVDPGNGDMVSAPISFVISNSDDTLGLEFVNEAQFEKTNIKTFYNEACPHPSTQFSVNIDEYEYNLPDNEVWKGFNRHPKIYTHILKNPRDIVDNTDYLKLLENLDSLLLGKYNGNLGSLNLISLLFQRGCTGGFGIKALDSIEKIEYPGTDSAYMLITHGSMQSVPTSTWMPVQVIFVFKKGDDFGMSVLSSDEYNLITKSNNLEICEELSEYGFKYIENDECVKDVLLDDLNYEKLSSLKNEWLGIFKLK